MKKRWMSSLCVSMLTLQSVTLNATYAPLCEVMPHDLLLVGQCSPYDRFVEPCLEADMGAENVAVLKNGMADALNNPSGRPLQFILPYLQNCMPLFSFFDDAVVDLIKSPCDAEIEAFLLTTPMDAGIEAALKALGYNGMCMNELKCYLEKFQDYIQMRPHVMEAVHTILIDKLEVIENLKDFSFMYDFFLVQTSPRFVQSVVDFILSQHVLNYPHFEYLIDQWKGHQPLIKRVLMDHMEQNPTPQMLANIFAHFSTYLERDLDIKSLWNARVESNPAAKNMIDDLIEGAIQEGKLLDIPSKKMKAIELYLKNNAPLLEKYQQAYFHELSEIAGDSGQLFNEYLAFHGELLNQPDSPGSMALSSALEETIHDAGHQIAMKTQEALAGPLGEGSEAVEAEESTQLAVANADGTLVVPTVVQPTQTPKAALLAYQSFIKAFGNNPSKLKSMEKKIHETFNCGQFPLLTGVTQVKKSWDAGCAYGLMAASHPHVRAVLQAAERSVLDPWDGLKEISEGDAGEGRLGQYMPGYELLVNFSEEERQEIMELLDQEGGSAYVGEGGYIFTNPDQEPRGSIVFEDLSSFPGLIHELAHFALNVGYHNRGLPLAKGEEGRTLDLCRAIIQTFANMNAFRSNGDNFALTEAEVEDLALELKAAPIFLDQATAPDTFVARALNKMKSESQMRSLLETFKNKFSIYPAGLNDSQSNIYRRLKAFSDYEGNKWMPEVISHYMDLLLTPDVNPSDVAKIFSPISDFFETYVHPDLNRDEELVH